MTSKRLEDMGKFKTVVVDPPWPLTRVGFNKRPHPWAQCDT